MPSTVFLQLTKKVFIISLSSILNAFTHQLRQVLCQFIPVWALIDMSKSLLPVLGTIDMTEGYKIWNGCNTYEFLALVTF